MARQFVDAECVGHAKDRPGQRAEADIPALGDYRQEVLGVEQTHNRVE
jgi:hypothetical protein